jgi:integrase
VSKKRKRLWRYSAGDRGSTVEVFEREPGGMLYARVWDPQKRKQVRIGLHHKDQERARQYAKDEAAKLQHGRSHLLTGIVTVGLLIELYLEHHTPRKKSAKTRAEDERRGDMWKRVLGERTRANEVTIADWEMFIPKRRTGEIDAHGEPVPPKKRVMVGDAAIAHDGKFLRTVYYWGMRWRTKTGMLIAFNPFAAPAPGVKSLFELPKNPTPKRPIVSDNRYERVRAVANKVLMQARFKGSTTAMQVASAPRRNNKSNKLSPVRRWMERSYLLELLDLHWETGRRRGAILDLRYNDLVWENGKIVAIRWRPVKHAEEAEIVIVSSRARAALERVIAQRPGVGSLPLFPAFRDRAQPLPAKTADEWLLEAEVLAKVDPQDGGLWHPYRRAWATKRKHNPDVDVAHVGGWKDIATMKRSYQQADDLTIQNVVENPMRLEEKKTHNL